MSLTGILIFSLVDVYRSFETRRLAFSFAFVDSFEPRTNPILIDSVRFILVFFLFMFVKSEIRSKMSEENGTEHEKSPISSFDSMRRVFFRKTFFLSFCRNARRNRTKFVDRTANSSRFAKTFSRSTNDPVETVRHRIDRQHGVDGRVFRFVETRRDENRSTRFVFFSDQKTFRKGVGRKTKRIRRTFCLSRRTGRTNRRNCCERLSNCGNVVQRFR